MDKLNVGMCHFLHQHCAILSSNTIAHHQVSILSDSDQGPDFQKILGKILSFA